VKAARADRNQPEIVSALRKAGATVQSLHRVGQGCPDLLVAAQGVNYVLECKDGAKPPSARLLTPDQLIWHEEWAGPVHVVCSPEEALKAVGLMHA
jgi:hypothetical protein